MVTLGGHDRFQRWSTECHYHSMPRTYSYADAVRLLGAKQSRILAALDRLVGGALLSGATLGLSELLGWFDAKADFVRWGHELLVKAAEKRSGLSRYDQTERLQAAHAVIVVVAFFDALPKLPKGWSEALDLNRHRQDLIMGARSLFDDSWPLPSAALPHEAILKQLETRYRRCASGYLTYLEGLRVWDEADHAQRGGVRAAVETVPVKALRAYEELLRRLGGEYPELRFWSQLQDGVAIRMALSRLEADLAQVLVGRAPDARRSELANRYQAALARPIITADEVPAGLDIPLLGEAYVDLDFQVARMSTEVKPALPAWWSGRDRRSDLHHYITGYLTSPEAVTSPLLVLGDPGSGKSVFTKVLAARLPASDFLTVRVELRSTPAEADVLDQIEHGIRAALHEDLSWAELSRSAGDALPVVVLDGLDELLQATGVSQSGYLIKIQRFQGECADAGRPVAVVVTSRISVTGGVQIPSGGHVLRLLPFTAPHIARWLEVWNKTNPPHSDRPEPVTVEVVLRHMDLAQQPLLLLMLALYDADGNALRREQDHLGEGDLYERLLTKFVRREVTKHDADRSEADLDADVESELDFLSVVAYAMFNRRVQWISESEVNADVVTYLGVEPLLRPQGTSTPLTTGEAILGRFFFVQCAEAIRDSQILRSYEFLHATFNEYLVARFTWRVLRDTMRADSVRPQRLETAALDDGDLFALLSFTPLTSRKPVLDFLVEMAASSTDHTELISLVKRLFKHSTEPHSRSRDNYRPVHHSVPARLAVYNLNLVLLHGVLCGQFDVRELGITDWPRLTAFWKSQLPEDEWLALIGAVPVRWVRGSVALFADERDQTPVSADLSEVVDIDADFIPALREADFTADPVINKFRFPLEGGAIESVTVEHMRGVVELGTLSNVAEERSKTYLKWADKLDELVLQRLRADPQLPINALEALSATNVGDHLEFDGVVCARLGFGEDDRLFDIIGEFSFNDFYSSTTTLDAWLRVCESGGGFGELMGLNDLVEILDLDEIGRTRPDLITRLRYAQITAEDPDDEDHLDSSP